jgi:small-conductance mechanosensitive channel
MARVKAPKMTSALKREWMKASVAGVVALAALIVGTAYGKITQSSTHAKVIGWSAAFVLLVAGASAVRFIAKSLGQQLTRRSNLGAGATLRLIATALGYLVLLFAMFAVLGVSLQHLLIGAGLAGVILGIAAQQSLSNVFAAIVLLITRPFVVGDSIRVRSGVLGVLDCEVLGIGLTYVTVQTDDGVLKIPNSAMLAAGIGQPRPRTIPATEPATEHTHPVETETN